MLVDKSDFLHHTEEIGPSDDDRDNEEENWDDNIEEICKSKHVSVLDVRIPNRVMRQVAEAKRKGQNFTFEIKADFSDLTREDYRRIEKGYSMHIRGVWSIGTK